LTQTGTFSASQLFSPISDWSRKCGIRILELHSPLLRFGLAFENAGEFIGAGSYQHLLTKFKAAQGRRSPKIATQSQRKNRSKVRPDYRQKKIRTKNWIFNRETLFFLKNVYCLQGV